MILLGNKHILIYQSNYKLNGGYYSPHSVRQKKSLVGVDVVIDPYWSFRQNRPKRIVKSEEVKSKIDRLLSKPVDFGGEGGI